MDLSLFDGENRRRQVDRAQTNARVIRFDFIRFENPFRYAVHNASGASAPACRNQPSEIKPDFGGQGDLYADFDFHTRFC